MSKALHMCGESEVHLTECSDCSQLETRIDDLEDDVKDLQEDVSDIQGDLETAQSKLDTIQTGAEVNVQSDWNETDTSSDAYIRNKPNITPITVDSHMDSTSTNPVQNQAIYNVLNAMSTSIYTYIDANVPDIRHETFILLAGATSISRTIDYTIDQIISVNITMGDGFTGVVAQGDWEITDDGTDFIMTCSIAEAEQTDVRFDVWWKASEAQP